MAVRTYKAHALAAAFPLLPKAEFNALVADIKLRGIRQPILVKGDEIIDGRNRYAAAEQLGLKPGDIPLEEYKGEDVTGEIIAANILRRHLDSDQRAALVAKLRGDEIAKGAKAAQGGKAPKKGASHEKVAAEAKVTKSKALTALGVKKHAPGQLDDVIAGKKRLKEAAKVASDKKAEANKKAGKVKPAKAEPTLQQRVEKKFQKFMESFGVVEYKAVRAIVRELVKEK